MNNVSIKRGTGNAIYYVVAIVLTVLFVGPVIWSTIKSFTGAAGFSTANYDKMVNFGEGLWTYVGNSVTVTLMTVIGTMVISTLGGYGFARFRFPGKNIVFLLTLSILMIPHATMLIPIYVLLGQWGLGNSVIGLALVMIMFQLPFATFMMRIAFESLPRELEEAALLDGCSSFGALRRILLRSTVPALVTVFIYVFLAAWNEFLAPLILLNDGKLFTLPVVLVSLRSGDFGSVDLGALQAGIMVTALPCVIIFLLLQKYYVQGITSGAVRG